MQSMSYWCAARVEDSEQAVAVIQMGDDGCLIKSASSEVLITNEILGMF